MKKGWISKKFQERCFESTSTKWYIKSPQGNYYLIFRGAFFKHIFLYMGEESESILLSTKWKDAIKILYDIEDNGTYDKTLSLQVSNIPLCKYLYSISDKKIEIDTTFW